jgi:stage II sporulation protein M
MDKERDSGLWGIFTRNQYFLLLSTILFLSSLFIGYAFSGFLDQFLDAMLNDFKRRISQGELKITTLSLFANNIKIALLIYAGGIFLGVGTVIYLLLNGLFIGYTAAQFPLGTFIIFTIPHGILEILGILIAGTAGFRLANIVFNIMSEITHLQSDFSISSQIKYIFESKKSDFKDSLMLIAIAAVLIFIAAVIEANFTISWGHYILNLLNP